MVQQRTALREHLDDVLVRVEDFLAGEDRRGRQEAPVAADGVVDREAVLLADDEVFLAVARRGVHGAGAAFERHVLTEDHGHDAIVERMTQLQVLEGLALHRAQVPATQQTPARCSTDGASSARDDQQFFARTRTRIDWRAASSRTLHAPRRPGWPAASTAWSSR